MGASPLAVTENVAACPAVTVWLAGCCVIVGAAVAGLVFKPGGVPAYPQANREMHIPVSSAHSSEFLGILKWQTSLNVGKPHARERPIVECANRTAAKSITRRALNRRKPLALILPAGCATNT